MDGWKPEHGGLAEICNSGKAPGFHGREKPGFKHDITVWRSDPLNDCKETFRRIESAGKMNAEMRHFANLKIAALEKQKAAGQLEVVDFGKVGHPLEKEGEAE